jgi:ketosteroid isomerase-like protein
MQPDNTELVREVIGALNRGDVDGMLARLDPDFEWTPLEDSPIAGTHRGHARVRRYVEDWLSTFDGLRLETEELTELDDRVLVVVRGRARGRGSGLERRPWGLVNLPRGFALRGPLKCAPRCLARTRLRLARLTVADQPQVCRLLLGGEQFLELASSTLANVRPAAVRRLPCCRLAPSISSSRRSFSRTSERRAKA